MRERSTVRVLLISPEKRLLLFCYRNRSRPDAPPTCWTTSGGGREAGETVEQTAEREVIEETGLSGVRLGPIVWYGEDSVRAGELNIVFKEHFIVAFSPSEAIDSGCWTEYEREEIVETRWWSLDEIRDSSETIYPPRLAEYLAPVLAGKYPAALINLPPG